MSDVQNALQMNQTASGYCRIDGRYTLFNRIELIQDSVGDYWADASWAKDIAQHRRYIPEFRLCAPVTRGHPPANFVNLSSAIPMQVFPLKPDRGWASVAANFFPNFLHVWSAIKSTDIVHSDAAGWSFPLSFYILFIRPFLRFRWIIVVESMFWHVDAGQAATLRLRLANFIHRLLLTPAMRQAEVRIFTHDGYRRFFLGDDTKALINPATWIDEENIISESALRERMAERQASDPLKLLFAARLIPEKGLQALQQAIELLAAEDFPVEVSILGDGPLKGDMERLSTKLKNRTRVKCLGVLPYGPDFLSKMHNYDAVLSLSTSNEQPRIIFDALSQGLPVIVTSTPGNISVINENCAILVQPGNGVDLAAAIREAATSIPALQDRGREGLAHARLNTHSRMHQIRSRFIYDAFSTLR